MAKEEMEMTRNHTPPPPILRLGSFNNHNNHITNGTTTIPSFVQSRCTFPYHIDIDCDILYPNMVDLWHVARRYTGDCSEDDQSVCHRSYTRRRRDITFWTRETWWMMQQWYYLHRPACGIRETTVTTPTARIYCRYTWQHHWTDLERCIYRNNKAYRH